eukprot:4624725-Ditylum_brightwellii.AAC.1
MDIILASDLPTRLTDQHIKFNGLKYPDSHCWKVFALIEFVYLSTATPENFIAWGGKLLREMLQYFLKVFGHVRAKDLTLRYNSNLFKGNTVGLHPTLAAKGGDMKKKGKRKCISEDVDQHEAHHGAIMSTISNLDKAADDNCDDNNKKYVLTATTMMTLSASKYLHAIPTIPYIIQVKSSYVCLKSLAIFIIVCDVT